MRERVHLTQGWEYKEDGRGTWQPASEVPGSIHTDLLHNGQIPDPFVDLNELAVRWVAERDWWYRRTFSPDELRPRDVPPARQGRVELVFEGLDTFATVYLNDGKVLITDNMFTSHRVDVTTLLSNCTGNLELKILFESASVRGRQLVKDHPEHNFLVRQTEAARLPVRKAQFHWGWDWGPILTTAGIWRPLYLDYYTARLDDVSCRYELSEGLQKASGKVCFIVTAASPVFHENLQVRSVLYGPQAGGENLVFQQDASICREQWSETAKCYEGHTAFEMDSPQLWFPHTYGRPNQYTLKVTLLSDGEVVDMQTKSVSSRTVGLCKPGELWVQDPSQELP